LNKARYRTAAEQEQELNANEVERVKRVSSLNMEFWEREPRLQLGFTGSRERHPGFQGWHSTDIEILAEAHRPSQACLAVILGANEVPRAGRHNRRRLLRRFEDFSKKA
jgi:hypothetical protein